MNSSADEIIYFFTNTQCPETQYMGGVLYIAYCLKIGNNPWYLSNFVEMFFLQKYLIIIAFILHKLSINMEILCFEKHTWRYIERNFHTSFVV